jgi:hypothetical protein
MLPCRDSQAHTTPYAGLCIPDIDLMYAACAAIVLLLFCLQRLPLAAAVLHPALTASPASLDFGLVHPSAPRPLQLLLTNHSRVDATWHAQLLMLPEAGDSTAAATSRGLAASSAAASLMKFAVEPASGVIPGRGLGMPRTQRITVTCVAAGNAPGAAELQLLVAHGVGCSVKLQGCGTFDEGREHLAVLKDM